MQLTDRQLVEVALLFIGLTKIFLTNSGFDHPYCKRTTSQAAGKDLQNKHIWFGKWKLLSTFD
jgi:hypothetical protein